MLSKTEKGKGKILYKTSFYIWNEKRKDLYPNALTFI